MSLKAQVQDLTSYTVKFTATGTTGSAFEELSFTWYDADGVLMYKVLWGWGMNSVRYHSSGTSGWKCMNGSTPASGDICTPEISGDAGPMTVAAMAVHVKDTSVNIQADNVTIAELTLPDVTLANYIQFEVTRGNLTNLVVEEQPLIPWWGWLIIALVGAFFLGMLIYGMYLLTRPAPTKSAPPTTVVVAPKAPPPTMYSTPTTYTPSAPIPIPITVSKG